MDHPITYSVRKYPLEQKFRLQPNTRSLACTSVLQPYETTVSPHHTRKSFFAKLAGFAAVLGLAPKLLGKSVIPVQAKASVPEVPFTVRTDDRAVARSTATRSSVA